MAQSPHMIEQVTGLLQDNPVQVSLVASYE